MNNESSNDTRTDRLQTERAETYRVRLDPEAGNDARLIALSFVSDGADVLDVGCACGDFGSLLSQQTTCSVYGMELNPNSIEIALSTNAYRCIKEVDLNALKPVDHQDWRHKFDHLVLLDVLEHVYDPQHLLEQLAGFLKSDGSFIVSLPNVSHASIKTDLLLNKFNYTETGILDETHVRFFTHSSIARFFATSRQEIQSVKPVVRTHLYTSETAGGSERKIPYAVENFIIKDPHSYVYQYVILVQPGKKSVDELLSRNQNQLDMDWLSSSPAIKRARILRIEQLLFPRGSMRYQVLQKLVTIFRGK